MLLIDAPILPGKQEGAQQPCATSRQAVEKLSVSFHETFPLSGYYLLDFDQVCSLAMKNVFSCSIELFLHWKRRELIRIGYLSS
ncbi:hypothetical protein SLH49_03405 [Cognatiyoonia sp. IB215446]|uniref:hypothetical protein n=1 Tax=Cognatiyoonia sp. IB215446 TaxID=3097355 RepID=UPI002A14360D|nr:hypothetical protein [Cognatiyoonia sp. IB215446]MDX8347023.1 hypothetical protein [Cognatiyoonia sp. IB215446]